jgi:hypothetical protein
VICGPTKTLLDVSVRMSVTVVEGLALGGAESVVDVAVLNQQIVVGANNFHGLLASSSLYHVLGVPVIHA